jgi:hypothetical protein
LLELTDRPFDDVSASIGFGIEHQRAPWFAAVWLVLLGDDRRDATTAKPIANPRHVVALVAS